MVERCCLEAAGIYLMAAEMPWAGPLGQMEVRVVPFRDMVDLDGLEFG